MKLNKLVMLCLIIGAAVVFSASAGAEPFSADNGMVTDYKTGLVWQQGEPGAKTWGDALSYCRGLSLGGHSDWRLPNIKALASLTDDSRYNPAIDTTYFPNAVASYYWSSSTIAGNPVNARDVYFYSGSVGSYGKNYAGYVRCVRGEQGGSLGYLVPSSNSYGFYSFSGMSLDPVNTATGNYVYTKKDLDLPGIGQQFSFQRNYNSQDSTDGPLGFGWSHSYNAKLTVNGDSTVTIRWGDGKTETWTPDGSGGYTPQYGVFDTLTSTGGGTFALRKRDLTRYNFLASGSLSSIIDKNNNAITLTYTGNNITTVTDTAGRSIALTYDANNRITLITDPIDRTVAFTYDGAGNLITARDMRGNITTYTYDADHQMLTGTDPRGNTFVTNVYDAQNRVVTSQKDAKLGQTTFVYDEPNRITTITDQLGNVTTHYHDPLRRLIQEKDSLNNSIYYTYDAAGNRTQVQDKKGNPTQYTYDARGNVLTKTDALSGVTTITYDTNNNPLTRKDALNQTTTFQYDANGNLTRTTDPLGNFTTIAYSAKGLPLTVTDTRGNVTTNTFDAQGNLTVVAKPLGNTTTYTYDGVGRRLTATDALNHTTTYTYDANNNLLTVTDPLAGVTTYTYDANNNKLTMTDPRGNTTGYAYDVKDLLTTITDPLTNTIAYTYDEADRKTSVKDKRNNTTTYAYNVVGNLAAVTAPLGNVVQYTYDANGNKLTETNPLGRTTTYTYDALNRLVSVTDPLNNSTTTAYDALGRVTGTTNAKSQVTSFQYDALGRLTRSTDSNGGIVQYTYDAGGNRLTMIDPKNTTTTYTYDALNRLTQRVEPLGSTYLYGYDVVGNRTSMTDAKGSVTTYTYDDNNRLTGIAYPDASTVAFTYDANGNRTQMMDSLGTSTYTYNTLNRMTAYTNPHGKTVSYAYDANGNNTVLTYPGSKEVNYSYDALNRLTSLTDWLARTTSYAYDAAGNLTTTTNPNGTTAAYTYDTAGRLATLSNAKPDASVIASYSYTLDALGNHLSVNQTEPLAPSVPNAAISYVYDAENRLTSAGGTAATYDVNGNMLTRGTSTFVYDPADRLKQSTIGGVVTIYGYDGLGNRLARTSGGVTTRYVLDVNRSLTNPLMETDGAGTATAYYVYGLGLASKILPDNTAFVYHYDYRGSTIAMTDAAQNVVDAYAYSPFGVSLNSSGTEHNPFRYLGRHGVMNENGADMYSVRARFYIPSLGRFLTKDPLTGKDGDSQSLNRYVYALNNPVRLIDVSGYSALEGLTFGNSGTSDSYHLWLLRERVKRARILAANITSAAYLAEVAAWNEAEVNILEGTFGALSAIGGVLSGDLAGTISGLSSMTGTFIRASGGDQRFTVVTGSISAVTDAYSWGNMTGAFTSTVNMVQSGASLSQIGISRASTVVNAASSIFNQGFSFLGELD